MDGVTDGGGEADGFDPAVRRAHEDALAAGAASYVDPTTGYLVLTEATLRAQGSCCGRACRHCPYPPDEQRRAGRPPRR